MAQCVEFYFQGTNLAGQNEREVENRQVDAILDKIPPLAHSFRFFEKDDAQIKSNFSDYHYVGTEYSNSEFKTKYPQLASEPDFINSSRIVKTITGGFYPVKETDIVVSV